MAKPKTLGLFATRKRAGRPIVMITAYDLTSARIAQRAGVDALLVGDSLGMVVLGHENTLPVTIDDMVRHTAAVVRAGTGLPVIADMPYGSFHVSPDDTVRHAIRLVKEGGAIAVKVEGGRRRGAVIEALLAAEIPVMGHVGLTPQSIHKLGGYKVQGRGRGAAETLLDEARFLEETGCFAVVLECVPVELARRVSAELTIPTIGIGAGPHCDGQVLVFHDLLGLFDELAPRFVKRYAELGRDAVAAVTRYAGEVREGVFPGPEHGFADETADAAPPHAEPSKSGGYLGGLEED
jgi:3-methyl-2-oxobutanoate hydroxymethyltransferase